MMQKLREKLHNQSGASILMALFLMLVAVMVSAVIVASAVSAATSVKSDRLQQQAYLTVSSAATLMRDDLTNCASTRVVKKSYTNTANRESDTGGTAVNDTKYYGSGTFAKTLGNAIVQIMDYGSFSPTECKFTADGYDDVTAKIMLSKGTNSDNEECYFLTVEFTGGEEPNECRIYLTATGNISSSRQDSSDYTWEWVQTGRYEKVKVYTYYRTTTTGVTWDNISLQRKVS